MIGQYFYLFLILAGLLRFVFLDSSVDLMTNLLSAFFGVGSIIAIWYFVGQLFFESRYKLMKEISAAFLAISPWHLILNRSSWKVSFAIFAAILGSTLLIKAIKSSGWLLIFIIVLILSTSQFYKPLVFNFSNTQVPVWLTDEQRREHGKEYDNPAVRVFHNKFINYSLSFLEHYSEHFSGEFLFIIGGVSPDKKIADFGQMYLFEIIFLAAGLFAIVSKSLWRKWGIVLLWLILAPLVSAFSFQPPDVLKSALMIVPLIIISSFGAIVLFELIYRKSRGFLRYLAIFVIMSLAVWDVSRFLHQYFFH